jgi:hypothetical protein
MTTLQVNTDLAASPWRDCQDIPELSSITRIGKLADGTKGGDSAVILLVESTGGSRVLGQTTLALLLAATDAFRASETSDKKQPDANPVRTLVFKTPDHPEASGRKPQGGETEYPVSFPLEGGGELVVKLGERGFQNLTNVLMDMLSDAPCSPESLPDVVLNVMEHIRPLMLAIEYMRFVCEHAEGNTANDNYMLSRAMSVGIRTNRKFEKLIEGYQTEAFWHEVWEVPGSVGLEKSPEWPEPTGEDVA